MEIEGNGHKVNVSMVGYSKRNLHEINHFMKVYAYAKTIGECENLSPAEQKVLEFAAIVHDIACFVPEKIW